MKNNTQSSTVLSVITYKSPVPIIMGLVLFQLAIASLVNGQPVTREVPVINVKASATPTEPQSTVINVHGKCEFSEDGKKFANLKPEDVLSEGAVVRTGEDARTDIFFNRIGTTVRLQASTEIRLEKMERHMKDGIPVMHTLLDLKKGRIFTVVRSFVPGCTLEIRNAAGRSVVEGGGKKGRYIITADGTHVTDKDSDIPLKVIGEKGITVVTPGQKFEAKEGKLLPQDPPEAVTALIEFDELQSLADKWDKPKTSKDLPNKKSSADSKK